MFIDEWVRITSTTDYVTIGKVVDVTSCTISVEDTEGEYAVFDEAAVNTIAVVRDQDLAREYQHLYDTRRSHKLLDELAKKVVDCFDEVMAINDGMYNGDLLDMLETKIISIQIAGSPAKG